MQELSSKRVGLGVAWRRVRPAILFLLVMGVGASCGGSDAAPPAPPPGRGNENAGQSCATKDDCYKGVEAGSLSGAVQCLDRVTGGYCTHLCVNDADCCAVAGECKSGFKQVCSPFENQGQKMCILSCEAADLHAAPDGGVLDETAYCQTYASDEFLCRSSGGGAMNRKVCVPGGGTSDAAANVPEAAAE